MTNLPPKYIAAFVIAFAAMIGWNAFLIQRDNKMFDSYDNPKEKACAQIKVWHPDCHLE